MPERIQCRRVKGWRKPDGAVYVGRPTMFGNPFTPAGYIEVWNPKATPEDAREACVRFFKDWIREVMRGDWNHDEKLNAIRKAIPTLRGKDLMCWCEVGSPCHADVLLELANRTQ